MPSTETKNYKVDFYVVTLDGNRRNHALRDLLRSAGRRGYTEALPFEQGDKEKYQIRSIQRIGASNVYKGVFGRCRFGETPEQGDAHGREADVELKPGHGLVEKNYFLFYADRNLIAYQRNASGSHYSRFQRYINLAQQTPGILLLEPILTTDAYSRLLEGGDARTIDISFQQPKDPSLYSGLLLDDAIQLVKKVGGVNARIRISVGRTNRKLAGRIKDAAVTLAKAGLATVARVKLEEADQPIDLITDRIISTIRVRLMENGRPDPEAIYEGLGTAVDEQQHHLQAFFGS
jgi:hypothetical protein